MNFNQNTENIDEYFGEIEINDTSSVDDFIRQLEAREKDLHISSDLVIEVGESEIDDKNTHEFLPAELPPPVLPKPVKIEKAVEPVKPPTVDFEKEISLLKNQVAKMQAERAEIFENSRRRQKDFEAYKSRTERERRETFAGQVSNLATQMLPVLDNLDRALNFAESISNSAAQEFQQFFDGIILVNQQLNEVLAGMGVSPIDSVGLPFDPHFHEAVATEETDRFAPNTVSEELLKGYRVGEKVIRASMVKVTKPVNG